MLLFHDILVACCRFESEHSVVLRFIIGSSAKASDELALQQEEQEHGDFMRLPLQVAAAAAYCRVGASTLQLICMSELLA